MWYTSLGHAHLEVPNAFLEGVVALGRKAGASNLFNAPLAQQQPGAVSLQVCLLRHISRALLLACTPRWSAETLARRRSVYLD